MADARVTLVTGGVRSGKSRHAGRLLADRADVTYVAAGAPPDGSDPEWSERIRRHRAARPSGWATEETLDWVALLARAGGPLLLECLGTWLTGVVDRAGLWERLPDARVLVGRESAALTAALAATAREVIVVSNEVGLSPVPLTPAGRFFQDELGRLTAAVAAVSDRVHLVVAGRVLDLSAAPTVGG